MPVLLVLLGIRGKTGGDDNADIDEAAFNASGGEEGDA